MAIDQDSGDATFATVVVEVLFEGQSSKDTLLHTLEFTTDEPADLNNVSVCLSVYTAVPNSPLGDERPISCTVGKALFLSMVFMTVLGCILFMVMWLKKKHKGKRDPLQRGCVAQGKHPNVVRFLSFVLQNYIYQNLLVSKFEFLKYFLLHILPQSLRWFQLVSYSFTIEASYIIFIIHCPIFPALNKLCTVH